MMLASHRTGGARRRLRKHCDAHRPVRYAGRYGDGDGDLAFELHATDGRTYTLRLSAEDVAAVAEAAGWVRSVASVIEGAAPPQAELGL